MAIIPTRCDCCGKMVDSFSDRSGWFGKYLKPDEDRICHDCIKDRKGYAKELLEKTGVTVEVLDAN